MFGENLSGVAFNNALYFLDGFFIDIDENYCITFKSPSIIDFLDYECDKYNLWETLIDLSFCFEQLNWLYYERIDYENENNLLEKLIAKLTCTELLDNLSNIYLKENIEQLISMVDSIKSTTYDSYIEKLFTYRRTKSILNLKDILEYVECIEPHNMPQNSIVLDFFITHCYPIFNKLETKENITKEECELLCAIIVRYIEQINLSDNIKIKQKIFINMDSLIKIAEEYVKNDNPNDLQNIYAENLLDYISIPLSD